MKINDLPKTDDIKKIKTHKPVRNSSDEKTSFPIGWCLRIFPLNCLQAWLR